MAFTGSALQIPGDLCKRIYNQVRTFSLSPEIKTDTFFNDIFENEILQYFQKSVMETYSSDIKMDIIRALEVEAEYEGDKLERNLITEYVKKVIKDTEKLADPFINRPVGEEPVPIQACAFNKKLYGVDNPERATFVYDMLKSFGGVECDDDEINTERVLFYSAIYGLFPDDLLKFSPSKKSKTATLDAGEYNKAYFDMISRIGPNPLKTKVITPHLHKHWHLISEMPDLNDKLQEEQEKIIYKALILGILYKQIRYVESGDKDKYRYSLCLKDSIKEIQLEVSNGTPCDTFYEIVDALTINPMVVKDILNAVDYELETARKKNIIDYEESALYKGIKSLTLRELTHDTRPMSIFGIAAAFKATMPPEEFIVDQGLKLLETMLETLYDQIVILCPESERRERFEQLVKSQLELFKSNFDFYKEKYKSIMNDYLRMLLQVVIKVLNDKEFIEYAEEVKTFSDDYFCGDQKDVKKREDGKKGE
jgi:hypothetical protein